METLENLDRSLQKLQEDFNRQLEILNNDPKEFHNALIDLSAKYPDHKELLQFIVFINDKLETNQSLFSEIITESFQESIKLKRELVKEIQETKCNIKPKPKLKIPDIKDIKIILMSLAIIVVLLGAYFDMNLVITVIKSIGGIFK